MRGLDLDTELRAAGLPVPTAAHRCRVQAAGGALTIAVPPPGLSFAELMRAVALAVGATAALFFAVVVCRGPAWVVPRILSLLGASMLLAQAAYVGLNGVLGRTLVRVTDTALHVSHGFPWPHGGMMARQDLRALEMGRPDLVRRGYVCRDWGDRRLGLVARGERPRLQFGTGLDKEELLWIKSIIEQKLGLPPEGRQVQRPDAGADVVQPPEMYWRNITTLSSYVLLVALVSLALLFAGAARRETVGCALVLVLFSGFGALLGYRSYRLERAASRWHRAVVRSLASVMELRFSPTDAADVGRTLPDFAFFRGPRQVYNVAWGEEDPHELIIFDYTTEPRGTGRDGVGCALRVEDLRDEFISVRPLNRWQQVVRPRGIQMPEYRHFTDLYVVRSPAPPRAQQLLAADVVATIAAWRGPGARPWVCIAGGMVGLSIPQRHGENDRTLRKFYEYARRIRHALDDRLEQLRPASAVLRARLQRGPQPGSDV